MKTNPAWGYGLLGGEDTTATPHPPRNESYTPGALMPGSAEPGYGCAGHIPPAVASHDP